MRIEAYELDNGIPVLLIPLEGTQSFTEVCMVPGGNRYETAPLSGISHFLEHMMFKGTRKRPTAPEIAREIENLGAYNNAITANEVVGYWIQSPARFFEQITEILADQMLHSLCDAEEIEREKSVVFEEIRRYQLNPMVEVLDILPSLIYGDQAAGRPIAGTEETVGALTQQQIEDAMRRSFTQSNLVIVCAGNLPSESTVLSLLNRHYGELPEGPRLSMYGVEKTGQVVPGIFIVHKNNPQTLLALSLLSPSLQSDDEPAVKVLATLLGEGMSSRLFVEVREKRGLAYEVGAHSLLQTDTGFLFIRSGVDPVNLTEALEVIVRELVRITQEPVPEDELTKAKNMIEGATSRDLEGSVAVASRFAQELVDFGEVRDPEDILEMIRAVTSDDVQRLAQRMMVNSGINLAVVGPHGGEDEILREIITLP